MCFQHTERLCQGACVSSQQRPDFLPLGAQKFSFDSFVIFCYAGTGLTYRRSNSLSPTIILSLALPVSCSDVCWTWGCSNVFGWFNWKLQFFKFFCIIFEHGQKWFSSFLLTHCYSESWNLFCSRQTHNVMGMRKLICANFPQLHLISGTSTQCASWANTLYFHEDNFWGMEEMHFWNSFISSWNFFGFVAKRVILQWQSNKKNIKTEVTKQQAVYSRRL